MNPYVRSNEYEPMKALEFDHFNEYNHYVNIQLSTINIFFILCLNIRSLFTNLDEFKIYLLEVRHSFDCLILSET